MYYVATKDHAGFDIVGRILHFIEDVKAAYVQHRDCARTYRELSRLTHDELDDIGICRADIPEIAARGGLNR
ncbi:DUF1127 domain-containing protein [Shimia sp. SDUM112013]|uniref:DUF1127 domain-containing protein n=1 Tax=Shimia sp. SDUM112013 TaxID=3136160 RepID=UPI0032EAB031